MPTLAATRFVYIFRLGEFHKIEVGVLEEIVKAWEVAMIASVDPLQK